MLEVCMRLSRWMLTAALAGPSSLAGAQTPPATPSTTAPVWPANRPSSATVSPETKIDIGTVRTVDPTHGVMICDMPDGQVTYDVSRVQVLDDAGKPLGAATALHPGDHVRVIYVINNGAKVSEVWVIPP
jgi:hypothetical protein